MTTFPQIISHVDTFGGLAEALEVWNCFYHTNTHGITELPVFVKKESPLYNFAYCSIPIKQFGSEWNFRIFTDPFDTWAWVVLLGLLILVSFAISISTHHNFLTTLFSALGALLDNEIRHITKSRLYILWLFTTLLINDFYSGAITSRVIAPADEIRLRKLADLEKNNFSIIFPHQIPSNAINVSIRVPRKSAYARENFRILRKFMKSSTILSVRVDDSFWRTLADSENVATILGYCYALFNAGVANKLISESRSEETRNKRCHVGQEMVDIAGERYLVFIPPGSILMARAFQILIASGIIPRWDQEAIWLMYADRVQDRAKIISRTRMAEEKFTFRTLRVEGKIVTIFLLWIVCVIVCSVMLTCELLVDCWSKVKQR